MHHIADVDQQSNYLCLQLLSFLTFYTKYVPDSIKKGLLTAVPKKDKDLSNPSNYRGITVISIICDWIVTELFSQILII
jgi:hypothetical protein